MVILKNMPVLTNNIISFTKLLNPAFKTTTIPNMINAI